ncbi:MAG: hypothetical protein ACREUG_00900, partial [Steroidobacteraceae bacterium]
MTTLLLEPRAPTSSERHVRWSGLHGSAAALALAECLARDDRLYIVVTRGARDLERLAAEIRFFGGGSRAFGRAEGAHGSHGAADTAKRPVLTLPDWEVL